MILERLEFRNFKRYSDETILFKDGITGIIGNNGAGKSTIVQGILFALYGVRAGIEGEFVVGPATAEKEPTSVTLDFSKDGSAYSITRWYRKTPATTRHDVQLKFNGGLLADGVSQVENEVERIIGMQASDFKNTIYAGQKDLNSLLDDSPAERQKWFMKMLGIDFLKKEADAEVKVLIDECRSTISGLETYITEKDEDSITAERDRALKEATDSGRELSALEEEIHTLEEKEERLRKESEDALKRWRSYQELSTEAEVLEESNRQKAGYIENLGKRLAEYEGLFPEFEEPAAAEEDYPDIKKSFEECLEKERRHSAISGAIKNLEFELVTERRRLEEEREKIEGFDFDRKRLEEIRPDIEKRKILSDEYTEMKIAEKDYRILESRKIRLKEKLEDYSEQAAALREEIDEAERSLSKTGSPEELGELIRKAEEEERRLSEERIALNESIKATEKQNEKLVKELGEISDLGEEGLCPTCRRPLGEYYSVLEEKLHEEIATGNTKARDLEEKAAETVTLAKAARAGYTRLESARREAERTRDIIGLKKKRRQELVGTVEATLKEGSELDREIEECRFSQERFAELEENLNSLETIYDEWRAISGRIKDEDSVRERISSIEKRIRDVGKESDEKKHRLDDLGFDPEGYASLRESFDKAGVLHQKYLELKDRIGQIPKIRDEISGIKAEVDCCIEKISRLRDEMEALGISEEAVTTAREMVDSCRREIGDRRVRAADLQGRIGHLGEDARRLEKELEEIGDKRRKYEALKGRMVVLEKTRGLIRDYVKYLLNVVRARIEDEVGRVLSEITDGRYENVLIDEDFDVLVNDLGENFPARRFSGGEQDDIAIALRIALSRYLAEMHHMTGGTFLIFDEIFGSQDEERRNNLISALRTQEAHFPQIFLISHISEIQGEFSNSLLVKITDDWNSEVIEVSN